MATADTGFSQVDGGADQQSPQQGGFFSRLGAGLKKVMPYVTPIANRLAAAAGNYGPLELEHQQRQQQMEQERINLQQQLQQSTLQNQELNRQLLQKQIANVRSPEETEALKPPADIVAPMETGGMGHFQRTYNPDTKQWETKPTMVPSAPQMNPAYGPVPMTLPPTSAGTAPQPPQFNPMMGETVQLPSPAIQPPPHQLPAIQKPTSAGGDIEPDGNSPTGFSRVWRGPNLAELGRVPAPAPSAYVGSTTSGETTTLRDTPEGQVPVTLPHTTTKTPIPPGGSAAAPPTRPTTSGTGGGIHVAPPLLPSSKENEWVSWQTPDGRIVSGSAKEALSAGAKNPTKVPAQEVRDIVNARSAVRIMTKQGDPNRPETQGVLQLINSLDKEGKLGILASRWNSFLTTGVGTLPGDDPRIITLIDKNMLGNTATMLAHFGASGGRSPQMLQHFLDLANARKMDGPTLKAGVLAMADYMQDRAQLPNAPNPFGAPPAPGGGFAAWDKANPR